MIKRYSHKEMEKIFDYDNQYNYFLQVELAALKALKELKIITDEEYQTIKKEAKINVKRIFELEELTRHDVIAFTRSITENLGDIGRFFHYGLTSTDIVDTANSLKLKEANLIIEKDLLELKNVLRDKALLYKNTKIMGRTHGMHAEVTSFGLKFLNWYDELSRDIERFNLARRDLEVVMLSGAVGNYTIVPIEVEEIAAKELNLNLAKTTTQVLSRDRHAFYLETLALIASLLEKIATEVRHLARSEINEVKEAFKENQKGSSAMPHKKNPISSENICGLARLMRSYSNVAKENNNLWHERDISHSSNERIILADSCILIDYMLKRYTKEINNLVVNEDIMLENIKSNKDIFSSRVLSEMILKGYMRDTAYDLIQKAVLEAKEKNISFEDYFKLTFKDYFSLVEMEKIFDLDFYLHNVDKIYKRFNLEEK